MHLMIKRIRHFVSSSALVAISLLIVTYLPPARKVDNSSPLETILSLMLSYVIVLTPTPPIMMIATLSGSILSSTSSITTTNRLLLFSKLNLPPKNLTEADRASAPSILQCIIFPCRYQKTQLKLNLHL